MASARLVFSNTKMLLGFILLQLILLPVRATRTQPLGKFPKEKIALGQTPDEQRKFMHNHPMGIIYKRPFI
jgi:hypothetical protein